MDIKEKHLEKREVQLAQANRDELVERITRAIREDGKVEPLKGLYLNRSSSTMEPIHTIVEPAFCVIAQGSKEIFLGNERFQYDPYHYLLVAAELPLVGHVIDASKKRPYLGLRLKLDAALVGSVMVEGNDLSPQTHAEVRAINVSSLDTGLLDAVLRLEASGHAYRSSLPRAVDHAGNRLPALDGRAG